jgi:putative protease
MNHRDANQGACTNACRWHYRVLEEQERPGEYLPIFEDEQGTYILNSKDLRAVQHVADLMAMGIDSLKIEGRTKSHYYVARTTQVYRQAITDASIGRPFDVNLLEELEKLSHRGYTEGFYRRHAPEEYQNYASGSSDSSRQRFVGEVVGQVGNKLEIEVKNYFRIGDVLELMRPQGNLEFRLEYMENQRGDIISVAPGSGHRVRIPVLEKTADYGLLLRNLTK